MRSQAFTDTTKCGIVYFMTAPVLAAPTVHFDTRLGVNFIDFDQSSVAQFMSEQRLSDEAITETTIFYSADTITKRKRGEDYSTFGNYDPTTKTITCYLGSSYSLLKVAQKGAEESLESRHESNPLLIFMGEQLVKDNVVEHTNEVLFHEIHHQLE
jgi:hypothetical protein